MKLNLTEIEKYAKDYIESQAYLDSLTEKRRKLDLEFTEQTNRHDTLTHEILDKFDNPLPVAVIVGKKIFTVVSSNERLRRVNQPIQIWNAALS